MQRKCQLSPFLFRSCQPAFSEKYLFLPEKPHRNDLNLKASSTSVSRKAAGLAAEGWGQLAGVPGPGLRLGTARPSPAPRAGTVLPQEAPCTPPCRCCSTEPGPHRAPAGLRRQHREGGRPRPRSPDAPSRGATWRQHRQAAATALFLVGGGAESGLFPFKQDVPSAVGMG